MLASSIDILCYLNRYGLMLSPSPCSFFLIYGRTHALSAASPQDDANLITQFTQRAQKHDTSTKASHAFNYKGGNRQPLIGFPLAGLSQRQSKRKMLSKRGQLVSASENLNMTITCALQDGVEVKRSERIEAEQRLPELETQLRQHLVKDGIDPDTAAQVLRCLATDIGAFCRPQTRV